MDFHPLVIHYPIAFLTTYAVFELIRFRRVLDLPYWFYIKGALVVIGEISALVTVIAAFSSDALSGGNRLVEMYKLFISVTALIFGISASAYLYNLSRLLRPSVLVSLSVIGLFFIVVAGGLFGATVYGTHFDPYLAPIFKLLKVY